MRPNSERGLTRTPWLTSYHTFSFGYYFNSEFTNFRSLQVINEDFIKPKHGFSDHSHHDMEIITIVFQGSLTHTDNLGHQCRISQGEIQRMTAGTGITHRETNENSDQEVHLFQIWIEPWEEGLEPSYQQSHFSPSPNEIIMIAAPTPLEQGVHINQNATISLGLFDDHHVTAYPCDSHRGYWLHVVEGELSVNEMILTSGDGMGIEQETSLLLRANKKSVFLLFELS
jgi:redox-sensitive bicupin YhaK (pirin superfamily)